MAVTLLGYTLMVLGVLLLFSSVSFGILTGIVGGGSILGDQPDRKAEVCPGV